MTASLPTSSTLLPNPTDRAPHHFSFVDALRGFAILAVVMTHCGQEVRGIPAVVRTFTDGCSFGVELFFVVSAFTLFWSLQNRRNVDRHPLKAFFVRRIFRIVPLFWLGVLFYTTHRVKYDLVYSPNGIGWPHIIATLLLVHGWYPSTINGVVPGGWSIAAEAMFYLCLPLLHKCIRSLGAALWITLVTTFASGLMPLVRDHILMTHFPDAWRELVGLFLFWSFPGQLPVFCMGLVLYFLLMQQMSRVKAQPVSKRNWSLLLLTIAAFLMLRKTPEQVIYAAAFVLVSFALAIHPMRLIVNPLTKFVGLVSFSIYIWHFWILYQLAPRLLPAIHPFHGEHGTGMAQLIVLYAVVLTASLAAATISYYIIERPSQQLGKRLITQMGWGGKV